MHLPRKKLSHCVTLPSAKTYDAANDRSIGLVAHDVTTSLRERPTIEMSLEGHAVSSSAIAAVDRLFACLGGPSLAPKSRRPFREAIGAIVFDLLRAGSYDPLHLCFRPMSTRSFVRQRIGYDNAKRAFDRLHHQWFINRAGGFFDRDIMEGTVTRFAPTDALLALLAEFGILPANRLLHFGRVYTPKRPDQLVLLNSASKWLYGTRAQGKPMAVDYTHPKVLERVALLNRYNAFMAMQVIDGTDHDYLRCIFNNGDLPDHHYDKGGRFWPVGGGYAGMPKNKRRGITFNGQPTVDLDLGSSHLTIYLAKNGITIDTSKDLYAIPGLPRQIVKWMVNFTLSLQRIPTRWPEGFEDDYRDQFGRELAVDYDFEHIQKVVYDYHPFLWDREAVDMNWADLQFIESEAIIKTVDKLVTLGIPVLPLHDSIRIPLINMAVADYILKMMFKECVGVMPKVKPEYQLLLQ